MKIILLLAILNVASARVHKQKAPLYAADSSTAADNGKYLVVFKEDIDDEDVLLHKQTIAEYYDNGTSNISIITHEWKIGNDFRGYAAVMDDQLLDDVRSMKEVKFVERDQISTTAQQVRKEKESLTQGSCTDDFTPWGLARTSHGHNWDPEASDYNMYTFTFDNKYGDDVVIFVIDTGIDEANYYFQGRAYRGIDFIDNPPAGDPNGHGTHVAGIAMAAILGFARSAEAFGVRVLDANGKGLNSNIIAGVNFVADYAADTPKVVGNMSLQGEHSEAINSAVAAAIDAGVHMVVAAGNDGDDACRYSPASEPTAYTVAASDIYDNLAWFSNHGSCVDIIAPGVNITSLEICSKYCVTSKSGTSQAAPHVAGVMAAVLSSTDKYDYKPLELQKFLSDSATKGAINVFGTPTVNKLLYYDCYAEY